MASVQCFKNAEKSYYQQSHHGHRMEHAMSHNQTQYYGQSEKRLPSGHGYMSLGYGYMDQGHDYMDQGHGYMDQGHGFMDQGHCYMDQGHGHMAQAHGHHNEHAMAKTRPPHMGQNYGHHQHAHMAETFGHYNTEAHGGHQKETSCHGKSKKKGEYIKKEKIIFRRKSRECKSGDSESESDSDNDRC